MAQSRRPFGLSVTSGNGRERMSTAKTHPEHNVGGVSSDCETEHPSVLLPPITPAGPRNVPGALQPGRSHEGLQAASCHGQLGLCPHKLIGPQGTGPCLARPHLVSQAPRGVATAVWGHGHTRASRGEVVGDRDVDSDLGPVGTGLLLTAWHLGCPRSNTPGKGTEQGETATSSPRVREEATSGVFRTKDSGTPRLLEVQGCEL